jgi:phospholipase C
MSLRKRGSIQPILPFVIASFFFLLLVPIVSPAAGATASVGFVLLPRTIEPSSFPISHIVYVIMENHAYDNYFGTYCTKLGKYCDLTANGIPTGTCVPKVPGNASMGCVVPYALPKSSVQVSQGGPHNWLSSHTSYDNGSMDGFFAASHEKTMMGYYTGSTLPAYWNWAEQFGLGDNFFSSALSFSLPNHWFAVAAQAPPESEDPSTSGPTFPGMGHPAPLNPGTELYLNQSNSTVALDDELTASNVSWKYYDMSLLNATYQRAVNQTVHGNTSQPSVFDFWDPLAAKAESYSPSIESHFVNRSDFFSDAAAGQLPSVAWIIPSFAESDHPPANLSVGEAFVSSIFNAIQNSSEWNSTAVFVTWDEYGGYYDHVAPPQVDGYGYGFRVPLLVMSAYTPVGYISPVVSHFESVLALIEWRFGLGNLSARDGGATLPLDYFDLNATPRPADHVFPTAPYPMALPAQNVLKPAALGVSISNSTANLSWSEASGGAPVAGFSLRWGVTHAPLAGLTVSRTHTAYNFTGLSCNTSYTFEVSSFAGGSRSPPSFLHATTGACGAVPGRAIPFPSVQAVQTGVRLRLPSATIPSSGQGHRPLPVGIARQSNASRSRYWRTPSWGDPRA